MYYYICMSIAIIAEYNPFHNGHIYQLNQAKKKWPNEDIIIIMSGKYVQRGELAIASFEDRKKIAIKYGAKQVIELPFEYSTQAAHIFAQGAIKIINSNNIDKIFFGSENNDPKKLMLIAKTIKKNEKEYNFYLKKNLKKGYSFPKSSAEALSILTGESIVLPNDILGLEYCKAIINNNFNITPYTLKRTIDFHSETPKSKFASASYIRKCIFEKKDISQYTPMKFPNIPDKIENYYPIFQKIVRETSSQELAKIHLISEGMENLFKKHIDAKDMHSFIQLTNSRRYTSSRIKRVMLYVLLKKYK